MTIARLREEISIAQERIARIRRDLEIEQIVHDRLLAVLPDDDSLQENGQQIDEAEK